MTMGFWQQRDEIEPVVTNRTVHDSWANGRDSYLTFVVDNLRRALTSAGQEREKPVDYSTINFPTIPADLCGWQ